MQVYLVSLDQNNLGWKEWLIIHEVCESRRKCSFIRGSTETEKAGRYFTCACGEPDSKLAKISELAFSGNKALESCAALVPIANSNSTSKPWPSVVLQMIGQIFQEPKCSDACLGFGNVLNLFGMTQVLEHFEVCFNFLMWTSNSGKVVGFLYI